jgi:hypothetical protein
LLPTLLLVDCCESNCAGSRHRQASTYIALPYEATSTSRLSYPSRAQYWSTPVCSCYLNHQLLVAPCDGDYISNHDLGSVHFLKRPGLYSAANPLNHDVCRKPNLANGHCQTALSKLRWKLPLRCRQVYCQSLPTDRRGSCHKLQLFVKLCLSVVVVHVLSCW